MHNNLKISGDMVIIVLLCFFSAITQAHPFALHNLKEEHLSQPVVGERFLLCCTVQEEYSEELKKTIEKTFSGLTIVNHSIRKSISLLNGKRTQSTTISWLLFTQTAGKKRVGGCKWQNLVIDEYNFDVVLERAVATQSPRVLLQKAFTVGYQRQAFPFALQCFIPATAQNIRITPPQELQEHIMLEPSAQKTVRDEEFLQVTYMGHVMLPEHNKLVIPAFLISYDVEQIRSFGFFNSRQLASEQIFSNALEVAIRKPQRPVHTIGTLTSYTCHLQEVAEDNQTAVVRIKIEGDYAALLSLKKPQFTSSAVRCYEGKSTLEHNTLCIEYVVQGLQSGTIELQPEDLYYLDIATEKIHKISSNKLQLTFEVEPTIADEYSNYQAPALTERAITDQSYKKSEIFSYWISWQYMLACILFFFMMYVGRLIWSGLMRLLQLIFIPFRLLVGNISTQRAVMLYRKFLTILYGLSPEFTYDDLMMRADDKIIQLYQFLEQRSYASGMQLTQQERRVIAGVLFGALRRIAIKKMVTLFSLIVLMLSCANMHGQAHKDLVHKIAHLKDLQHYVWAPTYLKLEQEIQKSYSDAQVAYKKNRTQQYFFAAMHLIPPILAQILCLMLLAFIVLMAWSYRTKVMLISLFCLSFFIVCGYVYERKYDQGLVRASPHVTLKNGPGHEYASMGVASFLDDCAVLASYNNWLKIRVSGKTGWVSSSDIFIQESLL